MHVGVTKGRTGATVVLLVVGLIGAVSSGCAGEQPRVGEQPRATALPYPIVDTGQATCYDNDSAMEPNALGSEFSGQDAQYSGNQPSYTTGPDGLTVTDEVTGLVWQASPDLNGDGVITAADKLTWEEAGDHLRDLNAEEFAGFDDWRLPTIKELYSLILFSGIDVNPQGAVPADPSPFIDTEHFAFAYGDTAAGERVIDSQYLSSTRYVSTTMGGNETVFGVNFADGRIKGYPATIQGRTGKAFLVLAVRGNPAYGQNDFQDNGDGTITDGTTGLQWAQTDGGEGLDWQQALAWVQGKNVEGYLGYDDWRLPNAKELQSLVDYTRSPDTTSSAAIDPLFECTSMVNEAGEADFPWYWTSTTHVSATPRGSGSAVYVCFGRAMGFWNGAWIDVHGAGAQRSDLKVGGPSRYPQGEGPQGDAIRIYNYVRPVRDAD